MIKCSGLDFKMPFMNAADPTKAYMAAWSGRCYLKDKMIQQGTGKLKVGRGCGSGWSVGETMSSGGGALAFTAPLDRCNSNTQMLCSSNIKCMKGQTIAHSDVFQLCVFYRNTLHARHHLQKP